MRLRRADPGYSAPVRSLLSDPIEGANVRTLIRLVVLGLAVYGIKALYDKFATESPGLRESGAQFLDRTSGAVREMSGKLSGAAHTLGDSASEQAAEVKATAAEQASTVRSAAEGFSRSVGEARRDG
jgi:hypothetical protein